MHVNKNTLTWGMTTQVGVRSKNILYYLYFGVNRGSY